MSIDIIYLCIIMYVATGYAYDKNTISILKKLVYIKQSKWYITFNIIFEVYNIK